MPLLSIVIPSYNEEKMILKAAQTINQLLKESNIPAELIFVNDGSKDGTWESIQRASEEIESVKGINFSRNFGKEAAILAGLEFAKGDCCVVMDCDLQHPPETVVQMYRLWEEGFEIVEGVKLTRGKESKLHGMFSKSFYRLINQATGFDMSKSSDFKLLDRKVVDAYIQLPERKLFFRALSFWLGFKSVQVEFDVNERTEGETKWSYVSLLKYALNNITSFSTAPMQLITLIGVLFLLFSVILGVQSLINYLSGHSLEGFTTIILLLLGTGSLIMISLGIIGFYISKIYEEVKRRPRYIVSGKTDSRNE
ncbi:dolichol-phosphate mannosyltransferase [Lysinibacillus composti]|uniref:Glycosyltransferase n=1 Tax=Lysinibacillus composti TaxID=720633 RepID=A0A3N9UHC0_9BACI|nr:glycosyltransferase family 2 protein [Lysinibacillus composti]MBM7608011.1 dolichol-phosphate mannosyltransferase [Lysinibacillus composti]RQW75471.1 glycosyltransferase [Lysinibacillus composti]